MLSLALRHRPPLSLLRSFSAAAPKPSAAEIKELRVLSGSAPLIACRNALADTYDPATSSFSVTAALDHLRLKEGGKIKAKTADREMAEGLVCLTASRRGGMTAASVSCETDFAAKGSVFVSLLRDVTSAAATDASLSSSTAESLLSDSPALQARWDEASLSVRENMSVRSLSNLSSPNFFSTYVHGKVADEAGDGRDLSAGKLGSFVELAGELDDAEMDAVGRSLAMHVVAAKPLYLDFDSIPGDVLEKEKAFVLAKMEEEEKESGKAKPDNIREKIAGGKLRKWAEGIVLLDQSHMADPDGAQVKKVLKAAGVECKGFGLVQV
jgi:elongation factor Ts